MKEEREEMKVEFIKAEFMEEINEPSTQRDHYSECESADLLAGEPSQGHCRKERIGDSYTKSKSWFPLPKFSTYVQPYLGGTAVGHQIKATRNNLIEEIIDYLDSENLLMSKNTMERAWGSRRLQRALLTQYPNIIKEECARKTPTKGELGILMAKVFERIRKRKGAAKNL